MRLDNGNYCIYSVDTEKTNIIIPEKINGNIVTEISNNGFSDGDYESIVLPDTIESIGTAAFIGCSKLSSIKLGNGLKKIGHGAFFNCSSLENVTFPDGMESIDGFIFGGCEKLETVYIPSSVTEFAKGNQSKIISTGTCPNAVIITPKGSPAEKVCIEQEIPYKNN